LGEHLGSHAPLQSYSDSADDDEDENGFDDQYYVLMI